MATLLLIRHCAPDPGGVLLGQVDSPLSAEGREHAASAFMGIEVEMTWCSPLRRAVETAAHVRSAQHATLSGLREIDHGEWSGKTWAEIETGWPGLARQKLENWTGIDAPAGESWTAFTDRVAAAWDMIRNGPKPAAVVAHQGVNAVLAALVTGANPMQFTQGYGEVISVECD
jgi:broad specificity phosphatase PhoE